MCGGRRECGRPENIRRRHSVLKEVRLPFKDIQMDEDCTRGQPVIFYPDDIRNE
jgi:hypothetical protein